LKERQFTEFCSFQQQSGLATPRNALRIMKANSTEDGQTKYTQVLKIPEIKNVLFGGFDGLIVEDPGSSRPPGPHRRVK